MKIALAQINPTVGDLAGNVERCLRAAEAARSQKADVVVLPEMVVPGYPPRDILFDTSFVAAVAEATQDLARRAAAGPPLIAGTLWPAGRCPPHHPGLYNAAVLLDQSTTRLVAAKRLLPAYDVFHEPRWFLPGPEGGTVQVAGRQVGILICEDLWDEGYELHPPTDLLAAGAELLICISASPYRRQILPQRLVQAQRHAAPLVYVNLCGATDELIFDGRSFALDAQGNLVAQLAGFEEAVQVVDLDDHAFRTSPVEAGVRNSFHTPPLPNSEETVFQALVLGVRDFARKNRLPHAFLGLSGGVDSAVVAVLASQALEPEQVTALAIPSRYTDPRSTAAAQELAQRLGLNFEVVELENLHAAAETTLGELLSGGTTAENVQARLRSLILTSYVNRYGGLLLNTSNKTELTLGYATLYGDMAGALCPIADLTKPEVYALARWIETHCCALPPFILERPPSAELRPHQVDPFNYEELAPAVEQLVRHNRSNSALRRAEHKRWQMGVILKVSEKAFGTGRLIPITRS